MQGNRNSTEIYKKKIASLINESIDEIDNGGELVDGETFFKEIKTKHKKK